MRPMTRVLNPFMGKLAGRRHFPMTAQIRHIGRRSGQSYVTPVGARLASNGILVPLTSGNHSDWARNVRAAGACSVRLSGRDYEATGPRFLDAAEARPLVRSAFNPVMRSEFRLLGIKQFMYLGQGPAE